MIKATFTLSERIAALRIFDAFKGSLTEMAVIMDDIKKLAITPEEWEKAKREIIKGKDLEGKDTEQWKWNDTEETFKEIELGVESAAYLKKAIKEKNDKNEITLADVALISLSKKLNE